MAPHSFNSLNQRSLKPASPELNGHNLEENTQLMKGLACVMDSLCQFIALTSLLKQALLKSLNVKLEGLLLLQHQLSLEVPQAIQLVTTARLFPAPPDGVGPS